MSIDLIKLWHERARVTPTRRDLDVQVGCHFEEVVEMIESLGTVYRSDGHVLADAHRALKILSDSLKQGRVSLVVSDRKELLDSLADQIVTAVGVGHCAGMGITEAVRRVNTSNWSKFDKDGQPIRDGNGKIAKGPDYREPELKGLY